MTSTGVASRILLNTMADFNEIKFSMEYAAMWYGCGDDAFFDYNTVAKNRKIKYPMLPDKIAAKLNNSPSLRIVPKQNGEVRILSADIALMSSGKHKNDATAIFINQMIPTKAGRYTNNIVYTENCEGLRTEEQALVIRKMFDEFYCDYIALDANGRNARRYGDISDSSARETWTLKCEHEWKAIYNNIATRNAYGLKLKRI